MQRMADGEEVTGVRGNISGDRLPLEQSAAVALAMPIALCAALGEVGQPRNPVPKDLAASSSTFCSSSFGAPP